MRLAHGRPGASVERRGDGWHVIEIVAAFAESAPGGEPARMVDYRPEDGGDGPPICAGVEPEYWERP